MPVLNIEGRRVRVDDAFLSLSPEDQQATVEDIAKQMGIGAGQKVDPATNQPPGVPQYVPPGVAGYDPKTGEVAADDRSGLLGKLDSAVRGAADMATLGFADEISAALGAATGVGGEFGDYAGNLERQRATDAADSRDRFGYRLGGQLAGGFALPASGATSVGRAALEGAALGGAYGFGSGEGGFADRMWNAAPSAAVGGVVGGALRAGANALETRAARKMIPSIDDLRSAANEGYAAADAAGVIVRPEGIRKVATETVNDLVDFGYHPQLQPRIGSILNEMERLGNTNTTFKGLDTLRKIAGQVANSNDPAEKAMASRIIARLDDYMANLPVDDVITGDAAKAAAGIRQGRDNWARMRRAELVDTAAIKAERRAASTGTGGNLDNALRQNVRSILDSPKRARGMTPEEIAMAEKVVRGTPTQDALRLVGRLSPTTGGLSAAMNVGATAVNPWMAIPGAMGMGAKGLADHITVRNVQRLSEMIRSGGKTAQLLAKMARAEQLTNPEIKMIEALAKHLNMPVEGMAAAVSQYAH